MGSGKKTGGDLPVSVEPSGFLDRIPFLVSVRGKSQGQGRPIGLVDPSSGTRARFWIREFGKLP